MSKQERHWKVLEDRLIAPDGAHYPLDVDWMGDRKPALRKRLDALEKRAALTPLLRRDLEQSYVRRHENEHGDELSAGIDFRDCSTWVCKNAREKLAEWDAALTETRQPGVSPEANARLIAAAPDLLTVAQALVVFQRYFAENAHAPDRMPGNDYYSDIAMSIVKEAHDAIAKATGAPS